MKWALVVLVWGTTPMPTGLVYDTLPECIIAESQARRAWIDIFNATPESIRKKSESRDFLLHQMIAGTCIPHP
jgi:hypothetical protein